MRKHNLAGVRARDETARRAPDASDTTWCEMEPPPALPSNAPAGTHPVQAARRRFRRASTSKSPSPPPVAAAKEENDYEDDYEVFWAYAHFRKEKRDVKAQIRDMKMGQRRRESIDPVYDRYQQLRLWLGNPRTIPRSEYPHLWSTSGSESSEFSASASPEARAPSNADVGDSSAEGSRTRGKTYSPAVIAEAERVLASFKGTHVKSLPNSHPDKIRFIKAAKVLKCSTAKQTPSSHVISNGDAHALSPSPEKPLLSAVPADERRRRKRQGVPRSTRDPPPSPGMKRFASTTALPPGQAKDKAIPTTYSDGSELHVEACDVLARGKAADAVHYNKAKKALMPAHTYEEKKEQRKDVKRNREHAHSVLESMEATRRRDMTAEARATHKWAYGTADAQHRKAHLDARRRNKIQDEGLLDNYTGPVLVEATVPDGNCSAAHAVWGDGAGTGGTHEDSPHPPRSSDTAHAEQSSAPPGGEGSSARGQAGTTPCLTVSLDAATPQTKDGFIGFKAADAPGKLRTCYLFGNIIRRKGKEDPMWVRFSSSHADPFAVRVLADVIVQLPSGRQEHARGSIRWTDDGGRQLELITSVSGEGRDDWRFWGSVIAGSSVRGAYAKANAPAKVRGQFAFDLQFTEPEINIDPKETA